MSVNILDLQIKCLNILEREIDRLDKCEDLTNKDISVLLDTIKMSLSVKQKETDPINITDGNYIEQVKKAVEFLSKDK